MRWMISVRYILVITSIVLGAFVAVSLAYNCHKHIQLLSAQSDLQEDIPLDKDRGSFPCNVEGTELVALSLMSYEGTYLEDGGDSEVANIAALMLRNNAGKHVCDARIEVTQGERVLIFELTHLPVDGEILVLEKNGQSFMGDMMSECKGIVRTVEDNGWTENLSFVPTGQRGLVVENLTERQLKDIVVYYKTFYAPAGFYVGGITYSVRIDALARKEEVQLLPRPFTSDGSGVVWVTLQKY